MATQVSLNSGAVASAGALALQTNGTTEAVSISTGQVATFAQNPILTSGTANGVAYLNGSKVLTTGSALVFDGTNLGVGVTPSAWASGLKAIELSTGGFVQGESSALSIGSNAYYDGAWKYRGNAFATRLSTYNGKFEWYTAPSGTAGNAITFTQAMTLDASGNLGVGTTSPTSRLHIAGDFASNKSDITLQNTGSSGRTWRIGDGVGGYSGSLVFFDATASAARMLLDSSGNLLVGQTAQTNLERFGVTQSGNGQVIYGYATDSSAYTQSVALLRGARNTTNATWSFLRCYNNADKLYIYDSGNVVNVNNSYGTLSDIKIKENITDATPKLADVMRLQVRNFNLKSDPDHKQIGFVAQELEQVFPSMVDESPDRDEEGNDLGTTTKSIKTSVLVPILVKAIQEQQSIIQSLTDRISALEGAKA